MLSFKLQQKMIKLALASFDLPNSRKKHFSFIVDKNTIVGFGYNQSFCTHPLSAKYGYRFNDIHAELSAILSFPYAPRELKNYTLVNIRLLKNKNIAISKPCVRCQQLLLDFNISEVYFTTNLNKFEKLI